MADLKHPGWIIAKGFLFLALGALAALLILFELPSFRITLLLAVAIWSFCRFYYFAFYVIERYVDPSFRFAGLWDFAMYLLFRRGGSRRRLQTNPLQDLDGAPAPICESDR